MPAWIGIFILVGGAVALIVSHDAGSIAGFHLDDFASITALSALAIFFLVGGAIRYGGQMGQAVKDITVWLALCLALVAVYTYRFELENVARRVAGELVPGLALDSERGADGQPVIRLYRSSNGHFTARARVNGAPVEMLVDTGASSIVLTQRDARRAGFSPDELFYSVPVSTANGRGMAASVRLNAISLGDIALRNVNALVASPGALQESLLGMTFLNQLRSYEFRRDTLILRK